MFPILFGLFKSPVKFLGSFTPQGTPVQIINAIVLIEMISTLIRPVTLSVRLVANITAGHLLLTIIVNMITSFNYGLSLVVIPMMLILELGVSFIQAYVLSTLLVIYSSGE
jgi:ATP synthase subunit 6